MSKVAISGNASGTGVFTLAAPNSNTDRTLTLPDEAGTVLTSAGVPASAMPAGSVIQVVSTTYDTRTEITGTASGSFSDTGLQLSITPKQSSSKILVIFNCNGVAARLGSFHQEPDLRLLRDSTEIKFYQNLMYKGGSDMWIPDDGDSHSFGATYLDNPNTTSTITYKIQIRGNTSVSGDMRVGINLNGLPTGSWGGGGSSITLMEVAA